MDDPGKPQTPALLPILIFAAMIAAIFGAALVTTFNRDPVVVSATDATPPGTTGLARPHPTERR